MKDKKNSFSLVAFILLCLIVNWIGWLWTNETVYTWYPSLYKPSWTPPDWIFGPVWLSLYLMIAVSGWLIYKTEDSHQRSIALKCYFGQLALNLIWSFLFFSLRSPLLGLIDIVLLCILVCLTMIKALPVNPLASLLLLPYLAWILYATTVNVGIWLLN